MTGRQRLAWLVVALAAIALVSHFLPVRAWSLTLADRLRGMGATGVALFIIVYALSAVAFLPGSLLTLIAGFAYGPVGGLLVASPASVLGATAAFLLGRSFLRDWAQRKLDRYPTARALRGAIGRHSFKLIVLLRLSPILPYNGLNYALGLTDVTLGRYVVASAIGMLPGTWLYVYLGSLATSAAGLGTTAATNGRGRLWLALVGLVTTIVAVAIVARTARLALAQELGRTTSV